MGVLKKIVIQDFRNITLQELDFSPNINCISGGNGEGKTNLLDAIWHLSITKSAFGCSDRTNIRHGQGAFAISGTFGLQDGKETRVSLKSNGEGEKKLIRDDKQYSRISDHIGLLPIVMVSPSDGALVSESSEQRRRFTNAVLSQTDKAYLRDLLIYQKLISQRNSLLKSESPDFDLLDILDENISRTAIPIYNSRKEFCEALCPCIQKYYYGISGGKEEISVEYSSELSAAPLEYILKKNRSRDLALKYTWSGIHRDDLVFKMNGYPVRGSGSQGQQKSFLVALKFAQYEIMEKNCGVKPILLLDDLFDKLDPGRVENLLEMVSGTDFGQIFITDPDKVRTRSIVDSLTSDRRYYIARGGTFSNE